ncbi:TetR/AcrR family transcriptional regulator [Pacificibacter marinus]|uniref:TetR/AcrR family transcriptional regulator n=1 Tax=Pacificibacter marinus TaxID=658057 RepID=UPI001C0664EF|nr:TetR/AcrR family transcriptional regulator [Pacificibacter marinus]MBU2868952.1 TetR family transcriptional regulator [Pacificibacter marinus]
MKKASIVKDRAATEARILNAARAVFARRGYDAAGLREIAEAAQANLSLISRYFGGKEGLLTALTDQFVASRREGKLSYPPQDTLEDEIYSYLHEKLRDDLKDEDIVRLIVSRAAIDGEFREKGRVHSDGLADENFRIRVGRLQDNGKVSPDINIDLLFAGVMHVSFSVNFFGAIVAGRPDTEIDALFHGFAAALAQGFPVRH